MAIVEADETAAAIQPGIPALLRARAREMRWDEMKWEEVAVGVLSCTR